MITEDYCSYEVAKLLKEKGFNEPCKVWYSEYTSQFGGEKYTSIEFDDHNRFKKDYKFLFHAPTHQMAMKWLRETYNINIEIRCNKTIVEAFIMTIEDLPKCLVRGISSNKYEETVEAALKYALENLI